MGLALFFLGCEAMVVQLLLMREVLASFSGNELVLGVGFGLWFAAIGVGAMGGRFAARHGSSGVVRALVCLLFLVLALLPPVLLYGVVRARDWLGLPLYATLSLTGFARLFLLVFGPVCLLQGLAFPCACRLAGEGRRAGVGRLYGLESLGGLLGGVGFGLAVLAGVSPLPAALAASALGFAALASALPCGLPRRLALLAALAAAAAPLAAGPRLAARALRWEEPRWAAVAGGSGRPAARLETPSQRLTLVPLGDQFVLYGNSQPLFMFPDPVQVEPLVRSVLARHPAPREVLLVGGNPADMAKAIGQAVDAPLLRVTYVGADAGIMSLTRSAGRGSLDFRMEDPVWFARQAPAGTCDVIFLMPPEPDTVGLNRFYTLEFYKDLRRLLRPGGFLWTSVEASEQLQAETGLLAASVYHTLRAVFPAVQATFGARLSFFAAENEAAIPMDRETLAAAAQKGGAPSPYFRPEMLLADEALDPVKRERVRRALENLSAPVNTLERPVTHLFMLLRWNRFSDSGLDRFLWTLSRLSGLRLAKWLIGGMCVAALLLVTALLFLHGRKRERVVRGFLSFSVAVTGFSAMAFELVLLFLAQSRFGYLYERLAFLVALFMAGLAGGSWGVRRLETAALQAAWGLSLAACAALAVLGVGLPLWLNAGWGDPRAAEWTLHGCMAFAGAAVGVLFPMINRLLRESGESLTRAAGATHASDNAGAALGSLLVGVVFAPVMGLATTCVVVAMANALLALGLVACRQMGSSD